MQNLVAAKPRNGNFVGTPGSARLVSSRSPAPLSPPSVPGPGGCSPSLTTSINLLRTWPPPSMGCQMTLCPWKPVQSLTFSVPVANGCPHMDGRERTGSGYDWQLNPKGRCSAPKMAAKNFRFLTLCYAANNISVDSRYELLSQSFSEGSSFLLSWNCGADFSLRERDESNPARPARFQTVMDEARTCLKHCEGFFGNKLMRKHESFMGLRLCTSLTLHAVRRWQDKTSLRRQICASRFQSHQHVKTNAGHLPLIQMHGDIGRCSIAASPSLKPFIANTVNVEDSRQRACITSWPPTGEATTAKQVQEGKQNHTHRHITTHTRAHPTIALCLSGPFAISVPSLFPSQPPLRVPCIEALPAIFIQKQRRGRGRNCNVVEGGQPNPGRQVADDQVAAQARARVEKRAGGHLICHEEECEAWGRGCFCTPSLAQEIPELLRTTAQQQKMGLFGSSPSQFGARCAPLRPSWSLLRRPWAAVFGGHIHASRLPM
ncbi:hypothetical protein CFIO01_11681 [Colletotrichum fioriniae PJ7]|uniref:Uncharacterized protein n=1 Tax=Colletotrichum fioriniae PJ7 TaxID=1445577 RepID=A0A010RIA9_9PEZI|nr:hypothetical protein CFIO01_11681 [Colletotrichum fioriniae PJ7]